MHFALTEEQLELAKAVKGLVERRAGSVDLRAAIDAEAGYDTALWNDLVEQIGVAALAIPEEFGGAGFSSFETHVVLEQLGYTLSPSPLLGSGVVSAQALLLAGGEARERLLSEIAAGTVAALAWADGSGRFGVEHAGISASGGALSGTSTLVLEGADAEILLAVADLDGVPTLFEVDTAASGLTRTATPAMDQTLRFATLTFENTPALALGAIDLTRLRAIAKIALTALQVGGAQACLDQTVAYLKEREQFERPLGSFQALKHRVADMLVQVESARSMSWAAGWAASTDQPDVVSQAALAGSWCTEAFTMVAGETIQLHGGIAITWEHDAHLYFKRAYACAELFGPVHELRRVLV
jgi:alkylation response protein AidB-like acyl-CoA dehydrogenase